MTKRDRRIGIVAFVIALALFAFAIRDIVSSKSPPPEALLANLGSIVMSFVGAGYVAGRKGRSHAWALLGFLNCIGIIAAFCLKDRLRRDRVEYCDQVQEASSTSPKPTQAPAPIAAHSPPRAASRGW